MSDYRIYWVATAKPRPSLEPGVLEKWWRERGKGLHESIPGVKSVRVYQGQWGLGSGQYPLEIWLELENYAAFDRIDEDVMTNMGKWSDTLKEVGEYWESGPYFRLVGEWPECSFM